MPLRACLQAKYHCIYVDWKVFGTLKWAQNWAALKTFWARAQSNFLSALKLCHRQQFFSETLHVYRSSDLQKKILLYIQGFRVIACCFCKTATAFNPFIYFFMGKEFREDCRVFLSRCWNSLRRPRSNTNESNEVFMGPKGKIPPTVRKCASFKGSNFTFQGIWGLINPTFLN